VKAGNHPEGGKLRLALAGKNGNFGAADALRFGDEGLAVFRNALSTASAASSPVDCTSRPRPASTFSLKIGVGLRVMPSYMTRRTEFEPMSMTPTGGP
jgi:hypothetical protein